MSHSDGWPDFLIMGAPKAGSSAVHTALALHPQLYLSPVKEPKYYLCGDAPPPAYRAPATRTASRSGSGAASDYQRLFAAAPPGASGARAPRSTSTPLTPAGGSPTSSPTPG